MRVVDAAFTAAAGSCCWELAFRVGPLTEVAQKLFKLHDVKDELVIIEICSKFY